MTTKTAVTTTGVGIVVEDRITQSTVTVTLTISQPDDLEGDARWIVPKAKAVLKRIEKYRQEGGLI